MKYLCGILAERTGRWHEQNYPCAAYPLICELLKFQLDSKTGSPRFLLRPQLRALETYWYLHLLEKTLHVFDLYTRYYQKKGDLVKSLGVPERAFEEVDYEPDELWARIRTDNELVRGFRPESLRETLTLSYPSYILALAMGAGKTIRFGAVIATEFAMAIEYPDGPFVENALVFGPGKTIIESLHELSSLHLDWRFTKGFSLGKTYCIGRL